MSIILEYEPDRGFIFEDTFIAWGTPRKKVRERLQGEYEINDQQFEDTASGRDLYSRLKGQPVFLFLIYDSNDLFSELEIYNGIDFKILDKVLSFKMKFLDAVKTFDKISFEQKVIDEGEVLFIDLKISLCSAARMGGDQEDNQLSYIYCVQDVSHL
jgi:hypothetical protein